ncbi:MAG TPA: DUF4019 domain-containing protein [Thermoanaerobaculia bacterium]|nr:DUF4019 domain-containing protein [Thermoanaerobaculia bacterium]
MKEIRRNALIGMAAGLCILAACTQNPSEVTVRDTPATTEPAATPAPEAMETPAAPQAPAVDPQLTAATTVGQQWLGIVDQGQYAESWSATGKLFQANMQQQQWVQTLTGARQPLGTVVSRELAGHELRTDLPGAPAGQYAIVSFATNFQNKPDIIETVTMMMEEDGQWHVVGYSANPRAALLEQQQQQQGGQQPGQPGQPGQTTPPAETTPTPTPTPPQV